MSFLDRLLGREPQGPGRPDYGTPDSGARSRNLGPGSTPPADSDAAAIERYRYLLRTAPPDAVEQAHREAFSQLTPEQRREVLTQLGSQVPASERATSDDPQSLARMATRAEMRRPGTLERSFGGGLGGGLGMGGLLAGSLLASVAGAFVGTAIADAMFDASDSQDGSDSADGGDSADGDSADSGDSGDAGGNESIDSGGGFDSAGDFGGGDFGDFGGGDF